MKKENRFSDFFGEVKIKHHYILETPHGETVSGKCKDCGRNTRLPSALEKTSGNQSDPLRQKGTLLRRKTRYIEADNFEETEIGISSLGLSMPEETQVD